MPHLEHTYLYTEKHEDPSSCWLLLVLLLVLLLMQQVTADGQLHSSMRACAC
jgi:hypothetical protein